MYFQAQRIVLKLHNCSYCWFSRTERRRTAKTSSCALSDAFPPQHVAPHSSFTPSSSVNIAKKSGRFSLFQLHKYLFSLTLTSILEKHIWYSICVALATKSNLWAGFLPSFRMWNDRKRSVSEVTVGKALTWALSGAFQVQGFSVLNSKTLKLFDAESGRAQARKGPESFESFSLEFQETFESFTKSSKLQTFSREFWFRRDRSSELFRPKLANAWTGKKEIFLRQKMKVHGRREGKYLRRSESFSFVFTSSSRQCSHLFCSQWKYKRAENLTTCKTFHSLETLNYNRMLLSEPFSSASSSSSSSHHSNVSVVLWMGLSHSRQALSCLCFIYIEQKMERNEISMKTDESFGKRRRGRTAKSIFAWVSEPLLTTPSH